MGGPRISPARILLEWLTIGVVFALSLGLVAVRLSTVSYGHGAAQWINDGHYENAAGQLCCGEKDCGYLITGHVKPVSGGYQVDAVFKADYDGKSYLTEAHEFVPTGETLPSPDGMYWRCAWGGERKCFFVPPPLM